LEKILKKVGEESAETIIAANGNDKQALVGEICDLFYHTLVLCRQCEIGIDEIESELAKRAEKIGNLKVMKKVEKNS
jgi:phosphoribosyl-ATP pyrophosphohydrolase